MLTTPLDIFYNPLDVPGETQHVFLNPSLHHFQKTCRIGETGFGTGLNLIAAAELFLRLSPPDATLTFISTEVAPLSLPDMAAYHATWPEHLQPLAASLRAVYPACLQALQTLYPRVFFQILPGDAAASLLAYQGAPMDAWFFDGFAPAVNPLMWTQPLFQAAARLSIPQHTTYGTFTAAGWVRQNLRDAGFTVEKIKGYGRKRHCLRGVRG
ncbi:MAG: tRNA (5-methylaminomethyl-2-thiouridine)(34)-methyltransferase MnmD [Holosporales bacterium]